MENLWENKAMLYSLMTSAISVFALAANIVPDVNAQFELVPLPDDVSLYSLSLFFWGPEFIP